MHLSVGCVCKPGDGDRLRKARIAAGIGSAAEMAERLTTVRYVQVADGVGRAAVVALT